jgi:hypothetical protein
VNKQKNADSTLSRGYGTLAGLGVISAAIFAVPSTLLLEPLPGAEAYLVTVAGLATGLACMSLPWERMDPRWLHGIGVLVTIEAAWAVAVFGYAYMAFYFLIAVSVAYATPDPRALLPHLALIGLALFGPVLYGPGEPKSILQMALVVYPLLVLTAGIFAYLRQRMVSDRRSYALFAEETLSLANRIAGSPIAAPSRSRPSPEEDLPALASLRVSTRAAAAAACLLSLPLIGSGLAVAGVKLPGFATESFGSFGIELPNQGESTGGEASAQGGTETGVVRHANRDSSSEFEASTAENAKSGPSDLAPAGIESAGGRQEGPAGSQATGPPNDARPDGPAPDLPAAPDSPGAGSVNDALDETLADVSDLLNALDMPELSGGDGHHGSDQPEEERPRDSAGEAAGDDSDESAERSGDRFAGAGDEIDEGGRQDAEEDDSERCDERAGDDHATPDPRCTDTDLSGATGHRRQDAVVSLGSGIR